jgi:hypothetical protein
MRSESGGSGPDARPPEMAHMEDAKPHNSLEISLIRISRPIRVG